MIKRVQHIYLSLCFGMLSMFAFPGNAFGQQDPMYAQYMFNTQTINPAYAGTWGYVGFQALARSQWIGAEGAPSTQTFSFQMPFNNYNMGLGLNIINDRIGLERRLSVTADYSYRLKLNTSTNLWMGIKGGFSNYSHNLSAHTLYPDGISDPAFAVDIKNKFLPNAGIGFLVQNPDYYIGLSAPKLIQTKYENEGNNFIVYGEVSHFFLIAGYVYPLVENIKFKPTLLVKAAIGSPPEADLSANFLLKEKFWIGATYRTGNSFGFIAQWLIENNLRIGYAIDISTSAVKNISFTSHEIMVSYELRFLDQKVISPRFF